MRKYAVLTVLALVLASPCRAEELNVWPATCTPVSDVANLSSNRVMDRSEVLLLRHDVELFAASIDAYSICLNSALRNLIVVRQQSGRTIDPAVTWSVSDLLKESARRKRTTIDTYSLVVSAFNAKLSSPGDFEGITDLNISQDLPPASATMTLPASARLLSISAHASHDANFMSGDCNSALQKAHRSGPLEGTAQVEFDVTNKGALINVHIYKSSGNDTLDNVAVICTAGRIYIPAILDGDPVAEANQVASMEFVMFRRP